MKSKVSKKLMLILIILPFLLTCEKKSQPIANSSPIIIDYPGFQFKLYAGIIESAANVIYDSLTINRGHIINHLRVSNMPTIIVSVWSNRNEFDEVQKKRLGSVSPGATGFINGNAEMFLFYCDATAKDAVHEFAHLVSLAVNPDFGNRPRWLWEAVAIYEAGERVDFSKWTSTEKEFPGFTSLNQNNSTLPYTWGYPLARFILDEWGDDAYINLILTNGNISGVLGIHEDEFITKFQLYINKS